MHTVPAVPAIERLAYRPREAAKALGCSHQTIYELLKVGRLRSIKVGTARLIPAESLAELLAGGGADDAA